MLSFGFLERKVHFLCRPKQSSQQTPCLNNLTVFLQDEFLFTVEGTGVLRPEEIVLKAMRILYNKLGVLQGSLNNQPVADPDDMQLDD